MSPAPPPDKVVKRGCLSQTITSGFVFLPPSLPCPITTPSSPSIPFPAGPFLFLSLFPHSLCCLLLYPCLPQRFVQRTVVATAFVFQAPVAVTTAGWAPGVTRGRVTHAVMNMALAGTANVNAVRGGMENTAPLVGWEKLLFWRGGPVRCIYLYIYVCVYVWSGCGSPTKACSA